MVLEHIPHELQTRKQWVTWSYVNDAKVPFQLDGKWGAKAATDRDTTWSHFQDAVQSAKTYDMDGIGFVFSDRDPFVGIDLDNCLPADGELTDWAVEVLNHFSDCYAEISPSGRGIKLWCQGTLPDSCRSAKKWDGGQGVEIYSAKRYFCVTGDCYHEAGIPEKQSDIDWFLNRFELTTTQQPAHAPTDTSSLFQRATAYVATVPGSNQGSRNNDVYTLAGKLFRQDKDGQRLSVETVLQLCTLWNLRNNPPLDATELETAVRSASTSEMAADTWPDRERTIEPPQFRLLEGEEVLPAPISAPKPPVFPDCCLNPPGLIGEIVSHNLATTMYPQPELAIAGAMAYMSWLTGRKICSPTGIRTNLYLLCIAKSGSGKNHARQLNKDIQHAIGMEPGPEDVASLAGLLQELKASPSSLLQIDEIGHFFQAAKDYRGQKFQVVTEMTKLYSSSNDFYKATRYADNAKTVSMWFPHLTIYGTTTRKRFLSSVNPDMVADGFLSRFLIFPEATYTEPVVPQPRPLPQSIIDQSTYWLQKGGLLVLGNHLDGIDFRGNVDTLAYSPQAKARFEAHASDIWKKIKQDTEEQGAIWSRANAMAIKLALLFAASKNSSVIELEDADRGVKLANFGANNMIRMVLQNATGDTDTVRGKYYDRLVGILRNNKILSHGILRNRTRSIPAKDFNELITELSASRMIDIVPSERTVSYRWISH